MIFMLWLRQKAAQATNVRAQPSHLPALTAG
jgi:hypothetical protein